MDYSKISASGDVTIIVMPKHEWDKKMSAIKEDGNRVANQMREQDKPFIVKPLAPKEMKGGDTVPLSGVVIKLDWKITTKLEMVESARDMITKAYILDSLDPGLPTVLKSIIQGEGLYEHSIGEFFQLYGEFQGKYKLNKGPETEDKMLALMNGDKKYMKCYKEHGKPRLVPLPYAVRNILAHRDSTNTLNEEGKELRTSIELLRAWVSPKK